MSAVLRLWRRAPLWRLSLYGAACCGVLAAVYPAGYLLHAIPALSRLHGAGNADNAAAQASSQGDASGAAAGGAPGKAPTNGRVNFLPLTQGITGSIPFIGHVLPLPAGVWHPVMSAQAGPGGVTLSDIFVRTDRGVVTGLIVASGTSHPIPDPALLSMDTSCHDDRAYARATLPVAAGAISCWAMAPFTVDDRGSGDNPLMSQALDRLHALGYPMPPLMIALQWMHLDTVPGKGVAVEEVNIMLSPAIPGTIKLPTPLQNWDKAHMGAAPAARLFVQAMSRWAAGWAPLLERGREEQLDPARIPDALSRDPAAPPPA